MEYFIENGPVFSSLRVNLKAGEQLKGEAGAMVAMSPSIELKAKTTGKGLGGVLGSMMGGESMFSSVFTANNDGELILAPGVPGDIIAFDLKGETLFAQGGAYLAGDPSLEISTKLSGKAMIGGEGLFLATIKGNGTVFLNSYGAVIKKELAAGEKYIVDTGHIVAFTESITYQIRQASRGLKGVFSSVASGEGLVSEYTGPGTLWLQTRNLNPLAQAISKYIVKR